MADGNSTAEPGEANSEPLFVAFKWHRAEIDEVDLPGERMMDFVADARDTASGIAAIMDIIEHDNLAKNFEERPLLNVNQHSALRRLARLSAASLNEEAERIAEWAYMYHTPAAIAKR